MDQDCTIDVLVWNLGDKPVNGFTVRFYDGAPGASGSEVIGDATYDGTLGGGASTIVSQLWTPSPATSARDIYIVVDPNSALQDRDRSKNTAVVPGVMKPDLAIDSIGAVLRHQPRPA